MTKPIQPVPTELPQRRPWLRVVGSAWNNPVDPSYARAHGGRWNAPNTHDALYLSADLTTALAQIRRLGEQRGFDVDDLGDQADFDLVIVTLPGKQVATDAVTDDGLTAVTLPASYPFDSHGALVPWERCQAVGQTTHQAGLRGVYARSAAPGGTREFAWFPARRQHATVRETKRFGEWRYADTENGT